MGGSQSKQLALTQVLNNIAIEVLTKNSTIVSGTIDQKNSFTIAGNTGSVKATGISQINSSKINVSALAQSVANNTLQADLISKLTSKLDQTFPALGIANTTTQTIQTIVTNAVKSNITTENMQDISAQVKGSNSINILINNNVDASQLIQKNEADLIIGLINNTNSSIVAKIATDTSADTSASQKPGELFSGLGTGSIFIIIIIVIVVVIGGLLYYASSNGLAFAEILAKPQVVALIAVVIAFIGYGTYVAVKPAK